MDSGDEMVFGLTMEECKCLFGRLKRDEETLSDEELYILKRLEKTMYSRLSIKEIEDLY